MIVERMPMKPKEALVYKTVVRPAMMYGLKMWETCKEEKRLDVHEMRLLRWMCGVTWKD